MNTTPNPNVVMAKSFEDSQPVVEIITVTEQMLTPISVMGFPRKISTVSTKDPMDRATVARMLGIL
jgi:hypothetical protein